MLLGILNAAKPALHFKVCRLNVSFSSLLVISSKNFHRCGGGLSAD